MYVVGGMEDFHSSQRPNVDAIVGAPFYEKNEMLHLAYSSLSGPIGKIGVHLLSILLLVLLDVY